MKKGILSVWLILILVGLVIGVAEELVISSYQLYLPSLTTYLTTVVSKTDKLPTTPRLIVGLVGFWALYCGHKFVKMPTTWPKIIVGTFIVLSTMLMLTIFIHDY